MDAANLDLSTDATSTVVVVSTPPSPAAAAAVPPCQLHRAGPDRLQPNVRAALDQRIHLLLHPAHELLELFEV